MNSMQEIKPQNNLFSNQNLKPVEGNEYSLNRFRQKNFLNGLQNARNILTSLEHSLDKSSTYENKLLNCKKIHKHSHDYDDWSWGSDFSDDKRSTSCSEKNIKNQKPQDEVNLVESWSTMSIVCLQYQYEELSKRYESLLRAFNDKCSVITAKESSLNRLRKRARAMHVELASAHRTLLCVGEKYLVLKKRRNEQLQQYDKKIEFLKGRVREAVAAAERARLHLDDKLSQSMAVEQDSEYALLLSEMRKCNQLFLENLRLKAQLEEFIPGSVNWSL